MRKGPRATAIASESMIQAFGGCQAEGAVTMSSTRTCLWSATRKSGSLSWTGPQKSTPTSPGGLVMYLSHFHHFFFKLLMHCIQIMNGIPCNGNFYHTQVIDLPFHRIPFFSCFISPIDNLGMSDIIIDIIELSCHQETFLWLYDLKAVDSM